MSLARPSSLPESDRAEMRQMRQSKSWMWSYEALADHFGCTRWTAMRICKQSARNDLESAIVTFAAMAGDVHNAPGKPTVANERKKE